MKWFMMLKIWLFVRFGVISCLIFVIGCVVILMLMSV